MFNKKTSRLLFLGVIALGVLYWWSENGSKHAQSSTFRDVVLSVEPDLVEFIEIVNHGASDFTMTFKKENGEWKISSGENAFNADEETVDAFLDKLEMVKTDRVVGSKPATFAKYGLGEGQGYSCTIKSNDGKEISFKVGEMTFANDAAGNQTDKVTYISIDGEDKVYSGLTEVGNDFLIEFDLWRPRYLWKGGNENWQKVVLVEGEASMTLEKKGEVWMLSSDTIIAERMDTYLDALADGRVALFDNEAMIQPGQEPIKQVVIYDALLDGPRSIRVYQKPNGQLFMISDLNPESVFQFDMERAYRKMFRPPSYFVPIEKLKDNPELLR